jgi:AcrR family transcriptional regulator
MARTVASTARDQIVEATCDLLEAQGYHATGFNQIVAESGAQPPEAILQMLRQIVAGRA